MGIRFTHVSMLHAISFITYNPFLSKTPVKYCVDQAPFLSWNEFTLHACTHAASLHLKELGLFS